MRTSIFLSMGFQSLGAQDLDAAFEALVAALGDYSNEQVRDIDATLDLGLSTISLSAEVSGASFLDAEGAGRRVLTELMKSSLPELGFEVVSSDASLAREQLISGL